MSLHATLQTHWDAVEADFQRYYRLDIRQPCNRGARRMLVLLRGLPEDAAVWRDNIWTLRDEVLAKTLEATDYWGRNIAGALGIKDAGKQQPPVMVSSDARAAATAPPPKRIESDPAAIRQFFASKMKG